MVQADQRISELDGLRGFAVLLVILWHYLGRQMEFSPGSGADWFRRGLGMTWTGVDLFFVLSGFLIGGILIDNRSAANYYSTFYIRRACRIFPVYYLLLGLFWIGKKYWSGVAAGNWLFGAAMPWWSYASFTQNVAMAHWGNLGANWLGATWSLAVEEQYYFFLPLLVHCISPRRLPHALMVGIVAAPLFRICAMGFGGYVLTACRIDSLLIGTFAAYLLRQPLVVSYFRENTAFLSMTVGMLFGGMIFLNYNYNFFGCLNHTWIAFFYVSILISVVVNRDCLLARMFRWKWLQWFGAISYGIYMFHEPISGLIHGAKGQVRPMIHDGGDLLLTAMAFVATLGAALLSHYGMEKRILEIGKRFIYRKERSAVKSENGPVLAGA